MAAAQPACTESGESAVHAPCTQAAHDDAVVDVAVIADGGHLQVVLAPRLVQRRVRNVHDIRLSKGPGTMLGSRSGSASSSRQDAWRAAAALTLSLTFSLDGSAMASSVFCASLLWRTFFSLSMMPAQQRCSNAVCASAYRKAAPMLLRPRRPPLPPSAHSSQAAGPTFNLWHRKVCQRAGDQVARLLDVHDLLLVLASFACLGLSFLRPGVRRSPAAAQARAKFLLLFRV